MLSRRNFVRVAATTTALSLAGCKFGKAGKTVKVGFLPISESLPLFVGMAGGYFEAEGLAIETMALDGGAKIVEGLLGGGLNFGLSNYVSLILANDSGLDVGLISGSTVESVGNPQHALMVSAKSKLSVAQLSGRKIAVNTRKNVNELFMRAYLEKSGIKPDDAVYIEVPFPRMLTALESGAVDAAGVIEPFVTFGQKAGIAKPLARFVVDVEDKVPIAGWLGRKSAAAQDPDQAARFQAAIAKAIAQISKDETGARKLLPTFTKLKPEDVSIVPIPTFVSDTPPATMQSLIDRIGKAGWMKNTGLAAESLLAKK